MKGLKGHAAQKFLEQCHVENKGTARCKETGRRFSRVRCFPDMACKDAMFLRSEFITSANICIVFAG